MSAGNVYRLVRGPKTDNLDHCLERLHHHAKTGRLRGIAFICLLDDNGFITDACGECRDNPEVTRTLLPSLDAKLARLGK